MEALQVLRKRYFDELRQIFDQDDMFELLIEVEELDKEICLIKEKLRTRHRRNGG
jgi:hypothetical protein